MALKIASSAGLILGVLLLGAGILARRSSPPDDGATTSACDLLIAVATILMAGSISVYLIGA